MNKYHSVSWVLVEAQLAENSFYAVGEANDEERIIAITGPKNTKDTESLEYMKYATLIQMIPQMSNELAHLIEQFDLLLEEHGEPFGWGKLTTERAKLMMAFIAACFHKDMTNKALDLFMQLHSETDSPSCHPRKQPVI